MSTREGNIGKILITPQGDYKATNTYQYLDIVSNNNGSYLYINSTPSQGKPVTNKNYWLQIAGHGPKLELSDIQDYVTNYLDSKFNDGQLQTIPVDLDSTFTSGNSAAIAENTGLLIASQYDEEKTYAVEDLVIHDGELYRCKEKIASPEMWTAGHWEKKSIGEIVADFRKRGYANMSGITSSTDIDTIKEKGIYGWTSNTCPSNAPISSAGKMIVLGASQIVQIVIAAQNTFACTIYARSCSENTGRWSDWIKLASEAKLDSELQELKNDLIEALYTETTINGFPVIVENNNNDIGEINIEDIASNSVIIRYKENLLKNPRVSGTTLVTIDEESKIFTINGNSSISGWINIEPAIPVKANTTYWLDGSAQYISSSTTYLAINDNGNHVSLDGSTLDRSSHRKGIKYIPDEDKNIRICIRKAADTSYDNVKFYPIFCKEDEVQRFQLGSDTKLTLLDGHNEIITDNFEPFTITYGQNKMSLIQSNLQSEINNTQNQINNIKSNDFTLSDLTPFLDNDSLITSSFILKMKQNGRNNGKIIGISSMQTSGTEKATIEIKVLNDNEDIVYTSLPYEIGGTTEYIQQEFKAPPSIKEYGWIQINVNVPDGTKLSVHDFYSFLDGQARHNDNCGVKWHAHAGFPSMAPANSILGFELAGKLGFSSCITIPKFTNDGVGICFHDDSGLSGLCNIDGSTIQNQREHIIDYTYDEIQNFRIAKTNFNKQYRIPTLDDFFRICSMYNMAPILSVHSANITNIVPTDTDESYRAYIYAFREIRKIATKWNVLNKLWIKSGNAYIQSKALKIFGTDIAGMIFIRSTGSDWDPLNQAKNIKYTIGEGSNQETIRLIPEDATSAKEAVLPLVFELFSDGATDSAIAMGLSEGFKVSIALVGKSLTGPAMRNYIEKGVTEFTDDYHCSLGLDWTLPSTSTSTYKLLITEQPHNQYMSIGETAEFEVAHTGGENVTYQWEFLGTASGSKWTNSSMTGSNTNKLEVPVTAARNGYLYRCVVTDNSTSIRSTYAKLTVTS